MNQTFYIDIDEEISSVIDRLNKSMSADNFFVIPDGAIFLQSVVNLKLLKREADKTGKHIVIVTQEKMGISMAQRAGLETCRTLEEIKPVSESKSGKPYADLEKENDIEEDFSIEESEKTEKVYQDKQSRLGSIGSKDFYDSPSLSYKKEDNFSKPSKRAPLIGNKISENSIKSVSPSNNNEIKKETTLSSGENLRAQLYKKDASHSEMRDVAQKRISYDIYKKENLGYGNNNAKEKILEKMFSSSPVVRQNIPIQKTKNVSEKRGGKFKKALFIFIMLCLLALAGVAAYLFLPNAEIIIIPNIEKNKASIEFYGATNPQDNSNSLYFPIRTIDQKQEISLSYDILGSEKKSVSGKKAHGNVVVYNKYNSLPQPLVSTTRLESPDGKIFRLVKGIVVPGATEIDGVLQPGAIEAEVIADQAGEDYNIEPTKFTIPGFSGGPKFDKFYAESSVSFTGGSINGESSEKTMAAAISRQDIDDAKIKTEAALNEKIKTSINEQLHSGEVVLPQAEKIIITKSETNAKVGRMSDSLEYKAEATARALVFSEEDVKKTVLNSRQKNEDVSEEISKLEYGSVDPDFENSTFNLKVYAEITTMPNFNTEKIKKEILGKNSDQLADILKNYPSVKNANVNFWPWFISSVPQCEKRVTISVDENK